MTDIPTSWPAPRAHRGSHVQHSWRCPRSATIAETVKHLPDGQALTVQMCTGCEGDDAAYRLRYDDPKDAA